MDEAGCLGMVACVQFWLLVVGGIVVWDQRQRRFKTCPSCRSKIPRAATACPRCTRGQSGS